MLEKEILGPIGLTAYKLAKGIGAQQTRISLILKQERAITANTAIGFSIFLGQRKSSR